MTNHSPADYGHAAPVQGDRSARASLSMTIQACRLTGFGFRLPSKTARMWR
jgi:hypothetical protein